MSSIPFSNDPPNPIATDRATTPRINRRVILRGVAAAALSSLALAACGGSTDSTATPATRAGTAATPTAAAGSPNAASAAQGGKTLNIIISSDYQPIVQAYADQFKQQTGTTVNITAQAYNQTHDKIVSGLAGGGAAYDLIAVDVIWTAEFAAAKFLAPLDDRITKSMQGELVPAALVARSYNGSIYQWPLFTMKYLYYNAKILKDAGFADPPKTWDELTGMSKAIQGKGLAKFGTAWAMSQAEGLICDYVLMANAFGGKYQDEKGNWILNQGGGLAALQYMVDSVAKEKIADPSSSTLDDRTNRNLFLSGEVPFLLNWASAYAQFKDPKSSKVADDVRIGLIPGVKEAGVVSSSCTGGSGFGVAAKSANKDTAWDFMKLMIVDDSAQRRWLKEGNQIPTKKVIYDDPQVIKDYPQFSQMRQQMDYGFGRPTVPWYGDWTKVLQLEINRAVIGEKTPKQALDDAMKQVNALQAENK